MSLKNKTLFYTHPKHIFLDVNGAIATYFSTYHITDKDAFEHATFNNSDLTNIHLDEYVGHQLVKYLLKNKNYLEDYILLDDAHGEIAKMFPNNCLSEETMKSLTDYHHHLMSLELICE